MGIGFQIGYGSNLTYLFWEGVEPSSIQVQNRVCFKSNPESNLEIGKHLYKKQKNESILRLTLKEKSGANRVHFCCTTHTMVQ